MYLYVPVRKQQVHHDVLGENLRVVDPEFNAGELLGQLLSLVLLSGLPDVVQQGVLKRGTEERPPFVIEDTRVRPGPRFERVSPGRDVDVLQQASEAVREGHAQRPQQVVPTGLHVLAGPALGVALAAHVLVVGRHDVGDEVVVTAGRLQKGGECNYSDLEPRVRSKDMQNACESKKRAGWTEWRLQRV